MEARQRALDAGDVSRRVRPPSRCARAGLPPCTPTRPTAAPQAAGARVVQQAAMVGEGTPFARRAARRDRTPGALRRAGLAPVTARGGYWRAASCRST